MLNFWCKAVRVFPFHNVINVMADTTRQKGAISYTYSPISFI